VIPVYGNFAVSEGKVIYRGIVEKMMDPQRVLNCVESRKMEEVALNPQGFFWATKKQIAAHVSQLSTMNIDGRRVRTYTPDETAPGVPQWQPTAQANSAIIEAAASASQHIDDAAGIFGVGQGQIEGSPMSGVAIQSLQGKADNATYKFFKAVEVAVCATARVLVNAIPKVYDNDRVVRLIGQDGSQSEERINTKVLDEQTLEWVEVNDLSKGTYDVTCDVGPSFQNKQQETTKALTELMQFNPELLGVAGDILLKNIPAPDVDLVAERVRAKALQNGLIPQDQWTKEEQEQIMQAQMMAAQQPQEPSPQDLIAQAEVERVQAETADTLSKAQERANKAEFDAQKLQLEFAKLQANVAQAQEKSDVEEMKLVMQNQMHQAQIQQQQLQAFQEGQMNMVNMLNQQAETLKTLKEAMGVDAIVGPESVETYAEQMEVVQDYQDQQ